VSRPQASDPSPRNVLKRMRQALASLLGRVWRHGTRLRARLAGIAAPGAPSQGDPRHAQARARFWAELREGQREAEAQCGRRDP
jgi:hypothetical protein